MASTCNFDLPSSTTRSYDEILRSDAAIPARDDGGCDGSFFSPEC